ncbi:kynurenine formamidase, partial [Ctenocephalides felis]|uniref:kynurenine formamidase n=1 Tax=Ctenocephalides felis TaxID=7515 RepID=UPI000E6E11C8
MIRGCPMGSPLSPFLADLVLQDLENISNETKQLVPCKLEIPTGDGPNQKIDIFGCDLPNDAPWLIYIHGGYWQELSRDLSSYPVQPLVSAGIRTVIAGYDLCPNISLSLIVSQIKETALFCLENAYSMGSRSVTFCGHSAGAHLASIILEKDFLLNLPEHLQSIVTGFCLISGIFDISPLIHTSENINLSLSEGETKALSPIYSSYMEPMYSKIKIIIAVGQYDSPAFILQSKEYYQILNSIFSNTQFVLINDHDHFNVVEDLYRSDYILTKM